MSGAVFSTTSGHYEYCITPYGRSDAPSVFQHLINGVCKDMLGKFAIAYIDDILIYIPFTATHVSHVRQVLFRLLKNQLYIKSEKCKFHVSSISFLGYSQEAMAINEANVAPVTECLTPRTVKELQCFPGFANFYRRFIHWFSSIATPLMSLLRRGSKWLSWNEASDNAFVSRQHSLKPHSQAPGIN